MLRQNDGISERAIFVLDRDGIIRYIDVHDIENQPDNEEILKVLRQLESGRKTIDPSELAISSGVYFEPEDEAAAPGGIVMYCARWCKDCRRARDWLNERGLSYTEMDIDHDLDARKQIRQWANGFLITPTFSVDGEIVLDFDIPKLEAALAKSGHLK